jgi:tRNA (cytidine/uridine-2'-O-)-methyltransferase
MLQIVLYQPDIPQNLGAVLRLSACMGAGIHVIEPCGFPFSHTKLRRAGMDYMEHATLTRHADWQAFCEYRRAHPGRLMLLETDGEIVYSNVTYTECDYVMLGSESAGTPRALYGEMEATLTIPMRQGVRSLNVAMAAGMLVAEAARQQGWKFDTNE